MDIKRKSIVIGLAALAAMLPLGYLLASQRPATPATTAPAVGAATASNPDELKFARGASQLTMIRSRALPVVALPSGATLSARVVYDEEATARLGVGLSGRVVRIAAAPGDRVKPGQVLAEIDSPDFGGALADLEKAKADEALKHLAAERARALKAGEGIAGKDVDAAEAELALARAETARARLRVHGLNPGINPAGLRTQGQRINLVSPIGGIVAERSVNPALEVAPGMAAPLFVVTDPRRLWLLLDVPEAMLADVRLGGRVDVESDAFPDEHFAAVVTQLGQAVDPDTRRVVVRARLDNPDARLLPGMFVRAALLEPRGSAVKVPNRALVNRGLYTYVFTEPEPGRFRRQRVTLLARGGDASFVGEGVADGARIVTEGALLLDAEMSARAGDAP